MVKALQLDTKKLDKLVRDFNSFGETIRARQDEKQSVIDSFEDEKKRFKSGKISKATLLSSKSKTNDELKRLDKEIRNAMSKAKTVEENLKKLISKQSPKSMRASESGVGLRSSGSSKSKKSSSKGSSKSKKKTSSKKTSKKTAKKRSTSKKHGVKASPTTLKKEKKLDRRYQKKK